MDIIEIVIIILLLILVGFILWDRLRQRQRWQEQSDVLSKTVGERIAETTKVFGDVKERLGELTQRTKDIQDVGKSISSLQEALRAPKFRGQFGEIGLETLLANILPVGCYSLQHRFRNGESIVDAVVQIGGNFVPIDSKFPLEDFERMVAAESEKEQAAFRRQFTRTIRKHIDDVTKYILPDEKTFDFALMYIPAENIYYETIIRDPHATEESSLYAYCCEKRVFPVSPNTFYAYLQAIVLGLKGLHIEKAAHEILGHLGRLQGDLTDFQEDYDTLGTHIGHAARKYEDARRKLTTLSDKLQLASETPVEKLPEGGTEADNKDE